MGNMCSWISKEDIIGRVESHIYEGMSAKEYQIKEFEASDLLSWNRFDLGFKLFYLDTIDKSPAVAKKVYREDIRSQTQDKYVEFGNENKNSFEVFEAQFNETFNAIDAIGFDEKKTLIPLANDGTIINGAHRTACAIKLEKKITCVVTEAKPMVCDYAICYERNIPQDILDIGVTSFIEHANNIYIAFLWPSGIDNRAASEDCFSNIVYKKSVSLSPRGAFNALVELYRHMDWVGTTTNGYTGARQKLLECFSRMDENVMVVVFQEESLDAVREIKQRIRDINGIGFSSVHITDTHEEAIRISRLLFNDNGLHFLNNADPCRYDIDGVISRFSKAWQDAGGDLEDVVLDGSVLLSLYGVRQYSDVDYIATHDVQIDGDFDSHESNLSFYPVDKESLIYDQDNYFYYKGVKFISFNNLYAMKKNRNEVKDHNDLVLMKAFTGGKRLAKIMARFRQELFYQNIKMRRGSRLAVLTVLKGLRLYYPARYLYRKLKGVG